MRTLNLNRCQLTSMMSLLWGGRGLILVFSKSQSLTREILNDDSYMTVLSLLWYSTGRVNAARKLDRPPPCYGHERNVLVLDKIRGRVQRGARFRNELLSHMLKKQKQQQTLQHAMASVAGKISPS